MRGKRDVGHAQVHDGRIIPAHAGQTRCGCRSRRATADHPRACGANARLQTESRVETGSSPRMRGKHNTPVPRTLCVRIIPAHAGQTRR